jgi:hypothetical protein
VRGDGLEVAARRRPGDRLRGRLAAQLLQGRQGKRQQRGPGFRLVGSGGLAEGPHRLREQGDLGARRQHRSGVVEGARASGRRQRRHAQADGQLAQLGSGGEIGSRDAGGGASEAFGLPARERAQRMEGARARSLAPGGSEGPEAEGTRQVDHQLARAHVQALADFGDGWIGDGEQDQIDVAQRRRFQPAAALPRREDADPRLRQRLEQRPRDRAAAEHRRGPDHSRTNSTPEGPARASNVSPLFTRPARISSARGDSTIRWITCRIGRAPSAAW